MHPAYRIILLTLALAAGVAAELPKKAPISKYTGLWSNSPFTSKPPPPEAGPIANPLEDYSLAGVSPISTGYRVTLLNKKKPEERITVDSGSPKSDFQILEVTRKPGDPLGTVVRMSSGSVTGTVTFDEKLLVLAAPPAPKAAPAKGAPGVVVPGQPPQPNVPPPGSGIRTPRPRVVPPPQPGQPAHAAQPTPAAQPVQQVHQAAQPSPAAARPIHRGGR